MNKHTSTRMVSIRITDEGCRLDLDTHVLTRQLGIQPTRTWRKGEQVGKWPLKSKVNGWELDSGSHETALLQQHLMSLKTRLGPVASILQRTSRNWDANLWIVEYVIGSQQEVVLEKGWLEWVSTLGLGVVLDTYVLSEE